MVQVFTFFPIVIGRSQKSLSPMDACTDAGRFPGSKKLSPMDATIDIGRFLDPKKLVKIRVLHQNNLTSKS